jgi:hypothetical protein
MLPCYFPVEKSEQDVPTTTWHGTHQSVFFSGVTNYRLEAAD